MTSHDNRPATMAGGKVQASDAPPDSLPPKVYSAPRRFGIGTLMGVAVACALFIAAMQQLDAPPAVIAVNGVFLTLIGVMQAVLIKTPRWASIVAGVVCFYGLYLWMALDGDEHICVFLSMLLFGTIYGYLGGAMVAGMFLVFDRLSQYFGQRHGGN